MQKISFYSGSLYQSKLIDDEWLAVINRLKSYGYNSTGSKTGDYALLKKIESRRTEQNRSISNIQALPLSLQQKIQAGGKETEKETETAQNKDLNLLDAADLLGEQLFLAAQMNKGKYKS